MSLLSGASIWTNDNDINKKRTSTLRRTIKKQPVYTQSTSNQPEPDEYVSTDQIYNESKHVSIDETVSIHEDRSNKVNALLDKMTTEPDNNDGQHLSNFSPPKNPELNQKKSVFDNELNRGPMSQPIPIGNKEIKHSNYGANNMNGAKLSNYQTSYEVPNSPYYSKMGIGQGQGQGQGTQYNDKVMDKINYLIHMLESDRDEKNENVIQDFMLYTFLGVFIIFVCDSFSRGGKYVR